MRRLFSLLLALLLLFSLYVFAQRHVGAASRTMYACAAPIGGVRSPAFWRLDSPPTNCYAGDTLTSWSVDASDWTPPTVNPDKPFAANSPWNTPTPAGTQWFDAAALHSDPSGAQRHWWLNAGSGIYYAAATDPLWTFQMPNFVAPAWNRNRPAQTFTVRAPADIAPTADSDSDLVVIQPDGSYVEVWQANVDATNRVVTSNPGPGWATGNALTGQGVGGLVATDGNNAGVRAANFSFAAGRISLNEINGSAPIDHALVMILTNDMLMSGNTYVSPATAGDGAGSGPIKSGSRIGIPAGTAQPNGLSPLGVKVFNALRTYGAFVGDWGGGNLPMLQMDGTDNSVACSLFCFWKYNGSSDMDKLGPLLRVADYQP